MDFFEIFYYNISEKQQKIMIYMNLVQIHCSNFWPNRPYYPNRTYYLDSLDRILT